MAEASFPGIQLQGDKGPRRIVTAPANGVLTQFQQRKARSGLAYVPYGSNQPAFSEHQKYCRLYINDPVAIRAVLELAASRYGVPLAINGDKALSAEVIKVAQEMGIKINSPGIDTNPKPQENAAPRPQPSQATIPTPISKAQPAESNRQTMTHPIADGQTVRFTPSKRGAVIEGKVLDSSTVDGESYRYRIALDDEGSRIARVYSDDGVFELVEAEATVTVSAPVAEKTPAPDRAGQAVEMEAWKLTKAEYLADKQRIRRDVGLIAPGYKVEFEYVEPGLVGPFTGVMLVEDETQVGRTIMAPFGEATVNKVSATKQDVEERELMRAGKLHHRRLVADAVLAGKSVQEEILAEYSEIQSVMSEWVQKQIASGMPLAPVMFNGMPSARGGTIHVTHDELSGSYDVSHAIDGDMQYHVTGVDAEGAREATQALLGVSVVRIQPPALAVTGEHEQMLVPGMVDNANSRAPAPGYSTKSIPTIDVEQLVLDADAAGETDFFAVIQASVDNVIQQVNQQVTELAVTIDAQIQSRIDAETALKEWVDVVGFLGDPKTVISEWQRMVSERDTLIDRVAELERAAKESATAVGHVDYEHDEIERD